jgi:uncharacterized protein
MALAPLATAERIRGIDLARGIALLGILFVNVRFFFAPLGFAMRPDVALDGSARGTADALAWSFTETFFTYKCISLFSMLFGFGLAMQAARARERGVSPWPSGLRRLGLLLAVGVVHWSLVWYGDILTTYAVLGLVVLACTGLSTNALRWCIVAVAGVVALVAVVGAGLYGLGAAMEAQAPAEAEIAASELTERGFDAMLAAQFNPYDPAWLEAERAAFREGPFTDALLFRSVNFAFGTVAAIFSYGWQSLLMMLCGVYAFKAGLFGPAGSEIRRRIAMPALAIGLALSVGSVLPAWLLGFESVAAQVVHVALLSLGAMVLPVAYAAIILEWGPRLPAWIATPVERAGRMSFTVYLLESVACTALASWWGLAWFGSLDDAQAAVVALCVWLALVIFATAWLAVLPTGPFEWAWRRVTYGRGAAGLRRAGSACSPCP